MKTIIEQSFSVFYDFKKQKVLLVAHNILLSEMGLFTINDAVFKRIYNYTLKTFVWSRIS